MVRHIVFVVFPGTLLLDLSGPLSAFEVSGEKMPYTLTVASADGGLVRTSSGLEVGTTPLAACGPLDTLVVTGGPGSHAAARDPRLVTWLRDHAPTSRRVCSVCTGAFVLAAAGLLDGRRAATHWDSCVLLQQRHPEIAVSLDSIYEKDGAIWTSAGATAGIDLALALIQEDHGRAEAIRVARRLVVYLKRSGGQAQFSVPLSLQAAEEDGFDSLHAWIQSNLTANLHVEDLAGRMGMSPRTFARHYRERTGRTPAKVVELLRLEAARQALEDSEQSLKEIAARCGFIDEERMRRSFQRQLGINPYEYRHRFRAVQNPPHTAQERSCPLRQVT